MRSADTISPRAQQIFGRALHRIYRDTDRMFAWLLVAEYVGAIVWAIVRSPFTWVGTISVVHPHVLAAGVLGGLIALPPILLVNRLPGASITRHAVATCQMMMSALLIHVSGGRMEMHFHIFVSFAFLSAYRDWRILVPATMVVLIDHIVGGLYIPDAVYGVGGAAEWRFLEHVAWVIFENAIVVVLIRRSLSEMRQSASRRAELEETQHQIEATVIKRTADLERSQLRTSSILENALDGIVSMNDVGLITEFNPAAEAIFGTTSARVAGMDLAETLLPADNREPLRAAIRVFFEAGRSPMMNNRLEMNGIRANGELFPMEITIIPVTFDGSITFTAFVRDISEHKRLLADLAQAQKLESIGQLAAGVAHEINTPNQYIGDNIRFISESFSSLEEAMGLFRALHKAVSEGKTTEDQIRELEAELHRLDLDYLMEEVPKAATGAIDGVNRVASIVRAMKEFSHPGQKTWTTVDINRVIEGTFTISRHEWKHAAHVELHLDHELPMFYGHPGELGQVFLNLIINSVHAINEKHGENSGEGLIRATTRQVGAQVEIIFEDNGTGIPSSVMPKIFDAFFTTKQVGIGTGQGLSITRRVIEQHHGGEIVVESSEEGARFILKLPVPEAVEELAA